jgi:2-polyprenyl-6-methoxyphenol hydroxylase-like FAD-dependent oxidoreductase
VQVYYDFDKYGWSDVQWIVHPEHWFLAARIGKDSLWRVAYGEQGDLDVETLKERLPWKFKTILPGQPTPEEYKVVNFSPFQMQQRCVERMRIGRVLLAGDAAHLCNPMFVQSENRENDGGR